MKLVIHHATHYRYSHPVQHSTQYLRLTPLSNARQRIEEWQLHLPAPAMENQDGYGNTVHVLTLDQPHDEIELIAEGRVEVLNPDLPAENTLAPALFLRSTALTQADEAIRSFCFGFHERIQQNTHAGLRALAEALHYALPYEPGSTDVATSASAAFSKGKGVCQDHAHIFIACCRQLNIPARYISGYLHTSDVNHVASHAWAEAWVGDRWHSFDITNNSRAGFHHVVLAIGMDYMDASPVRGVRRGGQEESMSALAKVQMESAQQ